MDLRLTVAISLWILLFAFAIKWAFSVEECGRKQWIQRALFFCVTMFVALVAWRWRSICYEGEINLDESQLLAQAMRYKADLMPWRSVDGGSSGPLNTWLLFWAPVLGFKFDYLAARLTSVLCITAMFSGLGAALVSLLGGARAFLVLMPAFTFVATTTNLDFAFLGSEQLPSAISAWIIFFIVEQARAPRRLYGFLIGVLTGALPFCKIQIGPTAVFLFTVGAGACAVRMGGVRIALAHLGIQAAGGLVIPLLILIPVAIGGAWDDFMEFYIRAALSYGNTLNKWQSSSIKSFLWGVQEFGVLTLGTFVLAALSFVLVWIRGGLKSISKTRLLAVVVMLAYVVLVAGSILRTGYPFPHYLMFLMVPYVAFVGVCLSCSQKAVSNKPEELVQDLKKGKRPIRTAEPAVETSARHAFSAVMLCGVTLMQAFATVGDLSRNKQFLPNWGPAKHPMGELIKNMTESGDSIVVWGWVPKFYVFSEMFPGTRFMQTLFLLDESPKFSRAREVYLTAFINDLEQSKPKLFIDAPDEFIWPEYPHGALGRHWAVPKISEYIRSNYTLAGSFPYPQGSGKADIMVYKRK